MTNTKERIDQRDITDEVEVRVTKLRDEQGFTIPAGYNYSNALKSAWFALEKAKDKNGKPALEVATRKSIANALFNMVTQGLNAAKTQCYFLVYGNELTLMRSYFGTQTVAKRLPEVKDIWAEVIHEGDPFEIGSERGRTIVTKFEPKFENLDKPIIGAYAVVEKEDGEYVYTIMTKKEIDSSWSKRKNSGNVQREFPQEMAKRTVINRAAKQVINTSSDDLLADSISQTSQDEYEYRKDVTESAPEPEKTKALEEKFVASAITKVEPAAKPQRKTAEKAEATKEPEPKKETEKPVVKEAVKKEAPKKNAVKKAPVKEKDPIDTEIEQESLSLRYPDPNQVAETVSTGKDVPNDGYDETDFPF